MENLINIFFKPKCIVCKRAGQSICMRCLNDITLIEQHFNKIRTEKNSVTVFSAFEYDGTARKCVLKAKFGKKEFAAFKLLSKFAITYCIKLGVEYKNTIVIPITSNKQNLKIRGFNQAEIPAKELASAFNLTFNKKALTRIKPSLSAHELNRKKRYSELANVFAANKLLTGKNVLLVDDILTTGATLASASNALFRVGVKQVEAFTVCKTPL